MLDVDYFSAHHALIEEQKSSPYEINLGWTVSATRARSTGSARSANEKRRGPAWSFVGLEVDWESFERLYQRARPAAAAADRRVARERRRSTRSGQQVGYATSGCWSPLLKKYLALAHLGRRTSRAGTEVEIEMTVEHRRKRADARRFASFRSSIRRAEARMSSTMPATATTRSSSAAATTASSPPRISRARARRSLVLERRPLVGGAAVTEEIFPGFKFSVFSYVVSLLRPEIIRDLDLPRARAADPAAREHGHAARQRRLPRRRGAIADETRRELRRHSPHDAEAMAMFGRLMQHMAMAVKPILGMVPPDPASLVARQTSRDCSSSADTSARSAPSDSTRCTSS